MTGRGSERSSRCQHGGKSREEEIPARQGGEITAGWAVMGAGHIQGRHRSRVKGIQLPAQAFTRRRRAMLFHSHGVTLKTTEP